MMSHCAFSKKIILLLYSFCLCWVFIAAWASLQLRRAGAPLHLLGKGLSLLWLLLSWSTASRVCGLQQLEHVGSVAAAPGFQNTGSIVVVRGLSCSKACGIFPDQGSNPCFLLLAGGFFTTEPPGTPSNPLITFELPIMHNGKGINVFGRGAWRV